MSEGLARCASERGFTPRERGGLGGHFCGGGGVECRRAPRNGLWAAL